MQQPTMFSPDVIARAERFERPVRVNDHRWTVRSTSGKTYEVFSDGVTYLACSCPAGTKGDLYASKFARCSHAARVLMEISEEASDAKR